MLRKCAHQAELSFALHICVCFAIYVCSTSNFFNKIKWFKNRRLRFLVQMYYLFYMLEWSAGLISMTFYNFLFSCWIWTTWGTIGFLHLSLSSFPLSSKVMSYTALWPQTALRYVWKWRRLEKMVMVSIVLLCTVDRFLHLFSPHTNEPLEIKNQEESFKEMSE